MESANVERTTERRGEVVQLKQQQHNEPAVYKAQWVPTANERNLEVVMGQIEKSAGKGRLVTITGSAGLGKTETTLKRAAEHECVHMLVLDIWRSPLPFLQALCREHGVRTPPWRTSQCFQLLVEKMIRSPKAVFLDEIDLTPQHLNTVRQLSAVTGAPFVLIGEDSLIGQVIEARRSWSRTYQALQFEPVSLGDLIFFVKRSAGLEISPEVATIIHKSACGEDWWDLERVTIDLVDIANSKRTRVVSEEMAERALKMALKGEAKAGGARSPYKRERRA